MATTKGLTPSESARMAAQVVTEEDLTELENLLHDLQGKCDQARADGRLFMMGQFVRLQALIIPEVARIQRRFQRESLASFRKEHKLLKLEAKEKAAESA